MTTKTCLQCGNVFEGIAAQAYCRSPCLSPSQAQQERKTQPCQKCGKDFVPRRGHVRCDECAKPWAPSTVPCNRCGKEYEKTAPAMRYCRACKQPKKRPEKACAGCGELFKPTSSAHIYCKRECNPKNQPKPRQAPRDISRTCLECGQRWTPRGKYVQTQKCFPCRERERTLHSYAHRKQWRAAVLSRADNACEECGKTAAEIGGPLHAHHVTPASQGGLNTLSNGKALCLECHAKEHDGAMGGATFATSAVPANLVDQIAQRVSEAISNDLERIENRVAAIEELAQRH